MAKQYAVVRTTGEGIARRRWVMSLHATRVLAEARLRSYVAGVLDGSLESAGAVSQYLPAGEGTRNLVPAMKVYGVTDMARPRAYYTGPVYVRKRDAALARTKKSA